MKGVNATTIQLGNENHTFKATSNGKAVASSITVNIFGFVGTTQKACTVGTISGTPTGMTITTNNNISMYRSIFINITIF